MSQITDSVLVEIIPSLAWIDVSPDSVVLAPGQTQQFTAQGYDSIGYAVQVFPLWSATGGVTDETGLYTAGSDTGTYWVTVADQFSREIQDSAFVVIAGVTAVNTENATKIPTEFAVYQNYPNPFNPSTTIRFDVAKSAHVKIILYDVLGRQVSVLVNERFAAGRYQVIFNAVTLPSGIYFYSIEIGAYYKVVKKVLILK
ncbi:MAG: T9SS type A sorting domain-containing protein [bacterium]